MNYGLWGKPFGKFGKFAKPFAFGKFAKPFFRFGKFGKFPWGI